ncbi:hypothetical protein PR048_001468 [Dryococelus australis]|uniref:Uncharacterized protein n=1 Tax=Dryococelus australis TaxID=614101 RepID=A0ABQ9IIX5_9NEOP|nr:hypothetical protein PR048_001468 [Dryococelus australis]
MQCLQRSGTHACRLPHFTAELRSGHAELGAEARSRSTQRDICRKDRPNLHPPPGESNSSVRESSVQTHMQDGTVDGSEKLVSLPIHTSPGTSTVSQTSLLENVPYGTDHFMARPLHLIDADDTLEDDDMTGKKQTVGYDVIPAAFTDHSLVLCIIDCLPRTIGGYRRDLWDKTKWTLTSDSAGCIGFDRNRAMLMRPIGGNAASNRASGDCFSFTEPVAVTSKLQCYISMSGRRATLTPRRRQGRMRGGQRID